MRKILILLAISSQLMAGQRMQAEEPDERSYHRTHDKYEEVHVCEDFTGCDLLEARAGYFFFTDGVNRVVWDNGTADVEIENTYWFMNRYSTFQNINFIWKDGSSSFGTPVRIDMGTISLGVKEFFPIVEEYFKAYLGFGVTCGLVWTNNDSPFIPNHDFWASPGIVGKSGLVFITDWRLVIDVFFDAYYQPIWSAAPDTYTDMGGFRAGGGLGYLF